MARSAARSSLPAPTSSQALPIRLRLQRLPGPLQTLAVAALAALQSADSTFTTAKVAGLFGDLRLPRPANISSTLGRHAGQGRLVRPSAGKWAFSPEGEHYLSTEVADVNATSLATDLGAAAASELGEQKLTLIPPFLAPAGVEAGLRRMLGTSVFETNVMLITRFPGSADDPFNDLIDRLRETCALHGLNLHLASDGNAEDTLWPNVVTYMWGSKYGIVIVDSLEGVLNSNVLIEVGGMLMTGRRCAILRDDSVPNMPTDLVGHIYKPVDLKDHDAVEQAIHRWLRDDLGLGPCKRCPS
jgi:hypothetical protein